MDVIRTPDEMRAWSRRRRTHSATIGFVPTMGALHAGHASLIERATSDNDSTVVSVFVNPTQFTQASDFDHYPRTEDNDLALCRDLGADAVYLPGVDAMYPLGSTTTVDPGQIGSILEGASRPGHFAGVATVVVKLFAAVEPDVAYFGEKDLQQVAVVSRVTTDLDLAVRIAPVSTVREDDGLAMSSRNVRLTPRDRVAAACISRALFAARDAVAAGRRDASMVRAVLHEVLSGEPRCTVDYAEVVDRHTFEQVTAIDESSSACIAAWFGDVRLIDNLSLHSV